MLTPLQPFLESFPPPQASKTAQLLLLLSRSVMSDSVRPHRRQPTRLLCPWDSPGKNTRVGCHFLLQCMNVKSEREVAQSCPTLRDPMDCSLPGSSIHGISRQEYWSRLPFPSPGNTAQSGGEMTTSELDRGRDVSALLWSSLSLAVIV